MGLGGHDLERSRQREGERGLRETLGFGSGNGTVTGAFHTIKSELNTVFSHLPTFSQALAEQGQET